MSEELKVTAEEIATLQIEGRENPMVCTDPEENQAKFDALPKCIAEKHNALADAVLQMQTDLPKDTADKMQAAKDYADSQDKTVLEKCLDYTNSVVGDVFAEAVVPADGTSHTLDGGVGIDNIVISGDGVNTPCYFEMGVAEFGFFFCPTDNNGAAVFCRSDVFVIGNGKALLYKDGLDSDAIEYVLPEIFAEEMAAANAVNLYAGSALQCVVTYRKAAAAELKDYARKMKQEAIDEALPKQNCTDDSELSLIVGDENENHGNYSAVINRRNYNEGENAFLAGYGNKNELLNPDNMMSSNNTFMCGSYNLSKGIGNAVFGRYLELIGNYKFGAGTFNKDAEGLIFQIGNGKSADKRSNAMAVDDKGNLYLSGDWFDNDGKVVYPSPFIHSSTGSVLTVVTTENVTCEVRGRGTYNHLNRVILLGTTADYEGREFIVIVDATDGTIYQERIINLENREGNTAVNVEFTTETIDFTKFSAEELASRIASVTLCNAHVEWSKKLDGMERIKAGTVEADVVTTTNLNTESANVSIANIEKLYMDGKEQLCITEPTGNVEDKVYLYKKGCSFSAGEDVIATFACGQHNGANRLIIKNEYFMVAPESLVGQEVHLYTSETEYVTEKIVRVEKRDAYAYNVEYSVNNVELGISKANFVNTYCRFEVMYGYYEWQPVEDIRQVVVEEANAYTDQKVAGVLVMAIVDVPYAENITVAPNQKNNIAQSEGTMEIALADGVAGCDNEWVFIINQGEIVYDIVLPEIDWYLGIAPTFLANTSTEVRLFYKNGVLSGVYF